MTSLVIDPAWAIALAINGATGMGWRIVAETTLDAVEKCCCPLAALTAAGAPVPECDEEGEWVADEIEGASLLLGIRGEWFVEGFDGSNCPRNLCPPENDAFDLGQRFRRYLDGAA